MQDADVIISNKVMVDADTFKTMLSVKVDFNLATGTNNIDLQQAKAQMLWCVIVRVMARQRWHSTLMLMLNLATSCLQYDRAVQQGEWNKASAVLSFGLPNYRTFRQDLGHFRLWGIGAGGG